MASIDERVVEMKFNRADFLKGTEESLNALERLEQSLQGGGGIADGVQSISNRMGVLGTIASGALLKLGMQAVAAGQKLAAGVMEPIFGGGKRRALNLEHAYFQLGGIYDSAAEVEAVMVNVGEAVDGTAYGLDAAAVAAAQFAATGMTAGAEMEAALKGISGVAAMAGASYEDISSVFTKVAGQGRVMGDDLNRLATRGINAAATLRDFFNKTGDGAKKTEADIREMVTKGKIDFKTFAAAMSEAFGSHAKKANDTYAGSLANIKAALARIGADYFNIEHEKMKRIFNALRPAITSFQKALGPLWETYKQLYAIPMAERFERWGAKLLEIDWSHPVKIMQEFLQLAKNLGTTAVSWIAPIGAAFQSVFNIGGGTALQDLGGFLERLNSGVVNLRATEEQAEGVANVFVKVFEAVKKFGDIVGEVFGYIGPVLEKVWDLFKTGVGYVVDAFEYARPYVEDFFEYLFGQEGRVTIFFQNFRREVEKVGGVTAYLKQEGLALYQAYIVPIVEAILRFKDAVVDLSVNGLRNLKDNLMYAFEPLQPAIEYVKGLWESLKGFGGAVKSPIDWLINQLPTLGDSMMIAFGWIKDRMIEISPAVIETFSLIFEAVKNLITLLGNLATKYDNVDWAGLAENILKILMLVRAFQTLSAIKGAFESVGGFFTGAVGALNDFNATLKEAQKGNVFLKVSLGLLAIAAALWLLSTIDPARLLMSVLALSVVALAVTHFVKVMDTLDGKGMLAASAGMMMLAFSLGLLAAAMILLGLVPVDVLVQGTLALAALLTVVTMASTVLSTHAAQLPVAALGLIVLAAALMLLMIPITQLGTMDYEVLTQGLGSVILLLAVLTGAAYVLGGVGPMLAVASLGILVMAAALTLMVIPITMIGAMPLGEVIQSLITLGLVLAGLMFAATLATGLLAGAAAIMGLSLALLAIAAALKILSSVPFSTGVSGILLIAMALGVLLLAAAAAMLLLPGLAALGGVMITFGVTMVLVAASVLILAAAISVISSGLPGMAGGLLLVGLALTALLPHVVTVALMAVALLAFSVSLAAFGLAALIAGAGALLLGTGLALMGVGMALIAPFAETAGHALMSFLDALKPAMSVTNMVKLTAFSVVMLALGAGLLILGVGFLAAGVAGIVFGIGFTAAALGMVLFTAAGALLSSQIDGFIAALTKLEGIAPKLERFAKSIDKVTGAITGLSGAIRDILTRLGLLTGQLTRVGDGFGEAGLTARSAADTMSAAMESMVSSIKTAQGKLKTEVRKIGDVFKDLSTVISTQGPAVSAAVGLMISMVVARLQSGQIQIRTSISNTTKEFQNFGRDISKHGRTATNNSKQMVDNIVNQLRRGARTLPQSIDSVVKAFDSMARGISGKTRNVQSATQGMISGMITTLRNNRTTVNNVAVSLGNAVVNGIIAGMRSGSGRIQAQARALATTAVNAAKNGLQIRSPSRVFYHMGTMVVAGLVNALEDGDSSVENASESTIRTMVDAVFEAIEDIEDWDGFNLHPTITPIVDLDSARDQLDSLGGGYGNMSRQQAQAIAMLERSLGGFQKDPVPSTTYNYHQELHSPEALSPATVYRQTRNLISLAEQRER